MQILTLPSLRCPRNGEFLALVDAPTHHLMPLSALNKHLGRR